MPNIKNYPKGFSIYSEPRFYAVEPQPIIEKITKLEKIKVYDGDRLPKLENSEEYMFESERDYDDGYDFYITKLIIEKIPNPNYEKELKSYNIAKEKHKIALKQYKEWAKKWKEEEQLEQEKRERSLLKTLQEKYKNGK